MPVPEGLRQPDPVGAFSELDWDELIGPCCDGLALLTKIM